MTLAYLWRERKRHPFGSRAWFKSWAKRVYNFPSLVKLSFLRQWLCWRGASIGRLAVIKGAEFNGRLSRLVVGDESVIARAHIALHGEVRVGNCVVINSGVTILSASHDISSREWTMFSKTITIHDYAWVAQGATILPGVTIGRGAVVGAGAVLSTSIPDYAIAVGNPAVVIAKKRTSDLNYSPVRQIAAYEAWLN